MERGPVNEILMDNSTAFLSAALKEVLDKWGIKRLFRASYRPSGHGIVERLHRTIKATTERSRSLPQKAVFWHNMSPKTGQEGETVPHLAVFKYEWWHP